MALQPSNPQITGILGTHRDDAYTTKRHMLQGKDVAKDLAEGKEAHVFEDGIDLNLLEEKVWIEGTFQGQVGIGQRSLFDRFVWCSPTPLGRRIQTHKPDVPLYWVEIKGKVKKGVWCYHLSPRSRPAS